MNDPFQYQGTESATQAAAGTSQDKPHDISEAQVRAADHEFPDHGEQDGRFYVTKRVDGDGELTEQLHEDNFHEVRLQATNAGYTVGDNEHLVDQASKHDGYWEVTYSVPVQRESQE